MPFVLIKIESQGKAVENWQAFLRGQNRYFKKTDGYFGEFTLEAAKEFQFKNGLQPDGIAGIKTHIQIKKCYLQIVKVLWLIK